MNYLLLTLFIIYIICLSFIIYLFLYHKSKLIKIIELDILVCPIHSPLNFLTSMMISSKNLCTQCNEYDNFSKQHNNTLIQITNLLELLKMLSARYQTIKNKSYYYQLQKYIWLSQNFINETHIYNDYDLYKKLYTTYDLSHEKKHHKNIISIENIEDINTCIDLCTQIQNYLFNSEFLYIIALTNDLSKLILDIQIECVQHLL